jgi:hypothetical protein
VPEIAATAGEDLDVSVKVVYGEGAIYWITGSITVKHGGGAGIGFDVFAYSEHYDGGCDSLSIAPTVDLGYPTKTLVEWYIGKASGAHPTVVDDPATSADTTGQTPGTSLAALIEAFTARGDTIFTSIEVYTPDDDLVIAVVDTTATNADYWRWWNYSWAACVTMDDAHLASLAQADSLFSANSLRFTSFYNPVWLLTRDEGAQQIANPTELAAYYDNGNFDIGGHGLTHGSLYNLKARGSTNDGGCVTAADTTAASNWDDYRAIWGGGFAIAGLQRYFDGNLTFDSPGISYDTGTTLFSLSGMTIGEHFWAEISRDSLEAFTGIPKAEQLTFAYPHYTHSVDIIKYLEQEGYLAARGSCDNAGDPWGDLESIPRNKWGEISLFRVPLLHTASSVFGAHDGEEDTKTRIRAAIGAKNPAYHGGLWPILTHSLNPVDNPDQFTLPEELAWWFTCVADSGGIIVGFQEAAEYYRERADYAWVTGGGDRVFVKGSTPPVERMIVGRTLGTARTNGANTSPWPGGFDISSGIIKTSLVGPNTGTPDSTAHPLLPTTGPTLRFNDAYRDARSGTPRYLWMWCNLEDLLAGADVDSVVSATYYFRMRDTGAHYQVFTGSDSLHVLVVHNEADKGWLLGAAPATYDWETNASWLYMDADDTETTWNPSLNTRIFQRGLATWLSYDSTEFALNTWYGFDLTAGIRKVIHDGEPFAGVFIIGVTATTGDDQYFSFHGEQYVSALRFPWWQVEYLSSRSPYWSRQ